MDENGKPLVMTHNTDNEFYTFDRERIGSGQRQAYLGFGFNFSRGRNSTYGNNTMQVYRDAKKPLESDGHKLSRADLEKALRQIEDGETDTVVRNSLESMRCLARGRILISGSRLGIRSTRMRRALLRV